VNQEMGDIPEAPEEKPVEINFNGWFSAILWGIIIALVAFVVLLWQEPRSKVVAMLPTEIPTGTTLEITQVVTSAEDASLPQLVSTAATVALVREINPRTVVTSQQRLSVVEYVVEKKDSLSGIANKFKLKTTSILWSNYDLLKDDPDTITLDMKLKIPQEDGILYTWAEGDTLESVAKKYSVTVDDIVKFTGNNLDLTDPQIAVGTVILVPGGTRETEQQYVMPIIARGKSGVLKTILGPGACSTSTTGGGNGSGTFIYPSRETRLSGNDYSAVHLGIDLAIGVGDPGYASDSGVIVFAGWTSGGYGYAIMIDHGNGFQTLYGHLSSVAVGCGSDVYQGGLIGFGGSTGNSTGPHLHFEVRYMGAFVNPWSVLP
jgi:LysM repeat protein